MKIVDLHNDLLSYLVSSPHTTSPYDLETRSSMTQYENAKASAVVYAAFTTQDAFQNYKELEKQASMFMHFTTHFPQRYTSYFAIENASTFAQETFEPLQNVFSRYEEAIEKRNFLRVYVRLTWNGMNWFGDGSFCTP